MLVKGSERGFRKEGFKKVVGKRRQEGNSVPFSNRFLLATIMALQKLGGEYQMISLRKQKISTRVWKWGLGEKFKRRGAGEGDLGERCEKVGSETRMA